MQKYTPEELLRRYQSGQCTEEEKAIVESWYLSYRENAELDLSQEEISKHLTQISETLPVHTPGRSSRIPMRTVAAVATLIIVGVFAFFQLREDSPADLKQAVTENIVPGTDKAVLTLADGSKIALDHAGEGELLSLSHVSIQKTAGGKIIYTVHDDSESNPNAFNTIETPKGGEFEVQLPDGSKVWLNAASSLRYPLTFAKNERKVELKGEAFFDIEHDRNRPFRVVSAGQTVEVLGTIFNINAYEDEQSVNTTLVEGRVKVMSGQGSQLIRPGQQARLSKLNTISVQEVNVESVVAWKNGYFRFDDTDLVTLMRQLSRWYDFDVVYEGQPSKEVFVGQIRRDASLVSVLKIIELGDIKFRVEGRTVYIKN